VRGELVDDRYRLVRSLGRGGFGEVHLAIDEIEGREVAVKLLDRGSGDQEQLKRRLLREARATQVLDETRVARVERVVEGHDGQLYVVMPFVAGETVRARILRGRLATDEALRILRELATTLDAAHAAGLVHRDVKPDNVILAADGRVVLLDFGIVKALTDESEPDSAAFASTQLTGSGALMGTICYVAPEQALGNDVDARADQFGLGVMAFELLTGRLPWAGELPARVLAQVLYEAPPPASGLRAEVLAPVDATFERVLAKQREARFASAGAFVDALEDAVRRGVSPAPFTGGQAQAAVSMAGAPPSLRVGDAASPRRPAWMRVAVAVGSIGLLAIAASAVQARFRAPAKWSASPRGTLAIPAASLDAREPCAEWLSGAIAEGLTSQLAAGGKVRSVGPRELGPLAHTSRPNRKGLREGFGADAVLEAECARPRAEGDGVVVRVLVTSASDDGRPLASFDVSGSARAPSDLVARLAERVRERLGIEPPDAIEQARSAHTLPQSADAARAYVEGLSKLDTFDSAGARAALEQAVQREPQFAPAHAALAKSFAYLGEQTRAAEESKLAAQNASSLPNEDRLLVEADADAASYAWDQAIETYRAIVKVFPDRADVELRLIRTYIDAGRAKDARAALADVAARTGESGDPRLALASALAANIAGDSAHADELAQTAGALADAVGLTNVKREALAAQCVANTEMVSARAEEICTDAARLLEAAGDRMGLLRVRRAWTYVLTERAKFAEAEKLASDMVDLANRIGSPDARATALSSVATIAKRRGDLAKARENALAAVAQADESGNGSARANTRLLLAGALLDAGSLDEGRRYYDEALVISKAVGADATTSVILQNLATYWLLKGNITKAREDAEESLVLCDRAGSEMDRPWALDEVGMMALESGEAEKARDRYAEAMALRTKLGLPLGSSRQDHAEALMVLGDLDGALQEITEVVEDNRSHGLRVAEEEARAVQARVLLARGEVAQSLAASDAGLALARELKMGDGEYVAARLRGRYLTGHHAEALAGVAAALAHTDQPLTQWDLRLVEGELRLRVGQKERGTQELMAVRSETHAAGDVRAERAAAALLGGNLDGGYR
jgi:tetratricopeptide (TPR) repeat protein